MEPEDSHAPSPTRPSPSLAEVIADLVARVAADGDLAPRLLPEAGRPSADQLADLVRLAAEPPAESPVAAPVEPPEPRRERLAAARLAASGLEHREFSLLASHLADALDQLRVDPDVAADILAGIAALRGVVVDRGR